MSTSEVSPQQYTFDCMRNVLPEVGESFAILDKDLLLRRMGSYVHGEVAEYDMTIGCMACSEECVISKRIIDNVVTKVIFPDVPEGPVFTDKGKKHCIEF